MTCHLRLIIVASLGLPLCQEALAFSSDDTGLPESVSRVERETGGRVLSAERRQQGGREMNRIKVYTPEGRVRVMWDEPRREAPARGGAPGVRGEQAPPPEMRQPPRGQEPAPGFGSGPRFGEQR